MAKSKKPAPKRKPKAAKRKAPADKRPAPKAKARPAAVKRRMHDLGGSPEGPIDREHHTLSPFEERVDALMMVLTNQHGLYKVDALRRTIEDMPPKDYRNLAYYEKWLYAMRRMLVEQGVLSDAEIDAKVAEIKAGLAKGGAA